MSTVYIRRHYSFTFACKTIAQPTREAFTSLNGLPTINDQVLTNDECCIITCKETNCISDVLRVSQTSHRHIPDELFAVLLGVRLSSEFLPQASCSEQRTDRVDANADRGILSRKALGCLHKHQMSILNSSVTPLGSLKLALTFATVPLLAAYHTRPGRGLMAPMEATLTMAPPFPDFFMTGTHSLMLQKILLTLTSMVKSNSSSVTSRVGLFA